MKNRCRIRPVPVAPKLTEPAESRPASPRGPLGSFFLGACLVALVAERGRGDDPPRPAAPALPAFTVAGVTPRAADADAPLADGWPKATRPGMIEVKAYPAYRGAVARGKDATIGSDDVLFYPLFVHITRRNVAMTSPVVSTYDPATLEKPGATGDIAMEFVYKTADLGPAGPGVGAVVVEDHPAQAYVCLGVQGELTPEKLRLAVTTLRSYLADHAAEWVEDGKPRRLGYHPPMVPREERWWEVQVPVKAGTKPR